MIRLVAALCFAAWLRKVFAALLVFSVIAGCQTHPEKSPSMPGKNAALLQEVTGAGLWFHAKKTRPIWVRRLEREENVRTLEGDEVVPAGNYLCRGEAGDIWPQTEAKLTARYQITDEPDAEGWRKCTPLPDAAGVMAAQVPHVFAVEAAWGNLKGKAGDYVVKDFADRDVPDPVDIWIVDQGLFKATYQRVEN